MPRKAPSEYERALADWIWNARRVSDRDDWIYRKVVFHGHTQDDVAQQYKITRNTVSQIVAKVRAQYTLPVLPDDGGQS